MEAVSLPREQAEFLGAHPGLSFSFLLALYADTLGQVPDGADAAAYSEGIGDASLPVLADHTQRILSVTPYDGLAMPGKCVLTPEMEILYCWVGHGNEDGLGAVVEHWQTGR